MAFQPTVLSTPATWQQDAGGVAFFWRAIELGERGLALLLLAACAPIIVLCSIVIVLLSRRSPFIAHKRVGWNGRAVWVFKLRTMWDDNIDRGRLLIEPVISNEVSDAGPKLSRDPRVKSRFALFCRNFSIDELPQLWNVARGEMAIIGPRPLTKYEIESHYGNDASELLSRKPGITGLWQVRGRSRLTYRQRRRLDLFLIRKWSAGIYMKIMLATVCNVVTGKDAR